MDNIPMQTDEAQGASPLTVSVRPEILHRLNPVRFDRCVDQFNPERKILSTSSTKRCRFRL
jgi:hypothetical protein